MDTFPLSRIISKYGATVVPFPERENGRVIAPAATAENLKDAKWRKRTGFDSVRTTKELAMDRPVALVGRS